MTKADKLIALKNAKDELTMRKNVITEKIEKHEKKVEKQESNIDVSRDRLNEIEAELEKIEIEIVLSDPDTIIRGTVEAEVNLEITVTVQVPIMLGGEMDEEKIPSEDETTDMAERIVVEKVEALLKTDDLTKNMKVFGIYAEIEDFIN